MWVKQEQHVGKKEKWWTGLVPKSTRIEQTPHMYVPLQTTEVPRPGA